MKCPLCNNEINDVFNICDCGCQPDYVIDEVNMELQEVIRLAENGEETFFSLMGTIYSKGMGVTPSFEKALYWYRKGAEANQSRAMHNLCVYYMNGIAVNEDYFEVIFYNNRAQTEGYYRLANQNAPAIVAELAHTPTQSLIDGSKNAKALADKNDPEGLYRYGMCFEFGIQNAKKIDMALNCYARSAQAGYMPAMLKTALLYFHGGGSDNDITFKDEKRALYWFAKASEKNNQTADFYIGYCYENGTVLEKNVDKALKWYKKAAARDQYQAHERLSEIYGEGIYTNKNPYIATYHKIAALRANGIGNKEEIKNIFKKQNIVYLPTEQRATYMPPSDVNTDTLTYLKTIRAASFKIPNEKIADKFYDISEVLTSVLNFRKDYTLNDEDFPLLINDYIPKIAQIAVQQYGLYAKTKKQNKLDENCAKMLPILNNLSDAMYEMYDQVMKNVGQNIAAECDMLDKSLMYDGFINEFEILMKK